MGIWDELFNEIDGTHGNKKIRSNPKDPNSEPLDSAEKAYYKVRCQIYADLEDRRRPHGFKNIIFKQRNTKGRKEPNRTFTSDTPYVYLQDIGLILSWAQVRYELSLNQIYVMLYLHPLGLFTREDLNIVRPLFSKSRQWAANMVNALEKKNILQVWESGTKHHYYKFTNPGRDIVQEIYAYTQDRKQMPTSLYNPLAKEEGMDAVIKRFNTRVKRDPRT